MARRRRQSDGEALVDVASLLPWWACVLVALVGYLVLHSIASAPMSTGVQPAQVGGLLTGTVIRGLATAGQFIVPIVFLAGAVVSYFRRRQREQLVLDVKQSNTADSLNDMSWQQFEQLVGEAFRRQGYSVLETGGGGVDGGVDLVLRKNGEKHLVQCKQWRAYKVGVEVVRELYGAMAAKGAAGGFVVTSGRFTEEASSFASGRNVKLLDGRQLHSFIKNPGRTLSGEPRPPTSPKTLSSSGGEAEVVTPACPVCSTNMVLRTAKKGPNAGSRFWGCTGFPSCKGTRPIG